MAARYDSRLWNDLFATHKDLYSDIQGQNPDVASGFYGEEARLKEQVGGVLSASSSGVGGTFNKSPLFGISADYATRRMDARRKFQSDRMNRLLGLSNTMASTLSSFENLRLGYANLDFQKEQANTFNWANLLPQLAGNVNWAV